jgi:hypothetical protein
MTTQVNSSALPSVTASAREAEIMATYLVKNPGEVAVFIKARRWDELAVFADYLRADVPRALAQTDQALFRTLRDGVTTALIMGFGNMDGDALRKLAAKKESSEKSPTIKKRRLGSRKKSGK